MTCDSIRPFLSTLDSLDVAHAGRVNGHLAACPDCRGEVVRIRKLRNLIALKRHEKPDEFFLRTFNESFHRRLVSEMAQKPSFRVKFAELAGIVRERFGLIPLSSAAIALVAITVFMVHISAPMKDAPKPAVVAKAAPAPQADRSVVEVESRLNQLVVASRQSKNIYVLDRVQYEPATHGSTVLAF